MHLLIPYIYCCQIIFFKNFKKEFELDNSTENMEIFHLRRSFNNDMGDNCLDAYHNLRDI